MGDHIVEIDAGAHPRMVSSLSQVDTVTDSHAEEIVATETTQTPPGISATSNLSVRSDLVGLPHNDAAPYADEPVAAAALNVNTSAGAATNTNLNTTTPI